MNHKLCLASGRYRNEVIGRSTIHIYPVKNVSRPESRHVYPVMTLEYSEAGVNEKMTTLPVPKCGDIIVFAEWRTPEEIDDETIASIRDLHGAAQRVERIRTIDDERSVKDILVAPGEWLLVLGTEPTGRPAFPFRTKLLVPGHDGTPHVIDVEL